MEVYERRKSAEKDTEKGNKAVTIRVLKVQVLSQPSS